MENSEIVQLPLLSTGQCLGVHSVLECLLHAETGFCLQCADKS